MVDCLLSEIKMSELTKLYADRDHVVFKHQDLSRIIIFNRQTHKFCSTSYFH